VFTIEKFEDGTVGIELPTGPGGSPQRLYIVRHPQNLLVNPCDPANKHGELFLDIDVPRVATEEQALPHSSGMDADVILDTSFRFFCCRTHADSLRRVVRKLLSFMQGEG
jgi:hypothetical protein